MSRIAAGQYKPGETFTCTKRQFDPTQQDGLGAACGTEIRMHGFHWCAQVCPKCLANYFMSSGTDMGVYLDHGFYPGDVAARVRANIAGNGGQYIPTFSR